MKRFRIGNDITINWLVRQGGTAIGIDNLTVSLYMTHPKGREEIKDFVVSGATVSFTFPGLQQKVLGPYTLTIDVRLPSGNRKLIQDKCRAFELVGRSCAECEDPDETIYEINF